MESNDPRYILVVELIISFFLMRADYLPPLIRILLGVLLIVAIVVTTLFVIKKCVK